MQFFFLFSMSYLLFLIMSASRGLPTYFNSIIIMLQHLAASVDAFFFLNFSSCGSRKVVAAFSKAEANIMDDDGIVLRFNDIPELRRSTFISRMLSLVHIEAVVPQMKLL